MGQLREELAASERRSAERLLAERQERKGALEDVWKRISIEDERRLVERNERQDALREFREGLDGALSARRLGPTMANVLERIEGLTGACRETTASTDDASLEVLDRQAPLSRGIWADDAAEVSPAVLTETCASPDPAGANGGAKLSAPEQVNGTGRSLVATRLLGPVEKTESTAAAVCELPPRASGPPVEAPDLAKQSVGLGEREQIEERRARHSEAIADVEERLDNMFGVLNQQAALLKSCGEESGFVAQPADLQDSASRIMAVYDDVSELAGRMEVSQPRAESADSTRLLSRVSDLQARGDEVVQELQGLVGRLARD